MHIKTDQSAIGSIPTFHAQFIFPPLAYLPDPLFQGLGGGEGFGRGREATLPSTTS